MQADDKNYIEHEVKEVLMELDSNNILSNEDRIELKDHFLNEIESLANTGLSDQEAFLIAKKRFGVLEDVNEEYQKVKPRFDLLRYGIIGVVAFCLIKSFSILINLFSQIFWMVYYQFDPGFVKEYLLFDIPFRLFSIFVIGFFASKFITRVNFRSLSSMWKFPIFYLFVEIISRLYFFFVIPSGAFADISLTMEFFANGHIVNYFLLIFIMLFASFKMYKMKVLEMEYV